MYRRSSDANDRKIRDTSDRETRDTNEWEEYTDLDELSDTGRKVCLRQGQI